jgi:hypothetical protein
MRYRTMAASAVIGLATLAGGCASDERPKQIPLAANLVTEGQTNVAYTSVNDGIAYVYDTHDDRVVWSGPVQRGQTVRVDQANDRVLVADRLAAEKVLRSGHDHQIYFESKPRTDRQMTTTMDQSNTSTIRSDSTMGAQPASSAAPAADQSITIRQPDQKVTIERTPSGSTTVQQQPSGSTTVQQQPSGSTTIQPAPAGTVDQQNTTTIERERTIQSK